MKKKFEFYLDPESENAKRELNKAIEETKLDVNELNEYLRTEIEYLETAVYRLDYMEENNKIVDELKLDKEINVNEEKDKYSTEEIAKIKNEIEKIKENIKENEALINKSNITNNSCRELIQKFKNLENEIKTRLLTINPEEKN